MDLKKALLPLVCSVAALTLSASASTVPLLTLTEVSSSQLNFSWTSGGSGSLNSISNDFWQTGTLAGPNLATTDQLRFGWIEPDDASEFNEVIVRSSGNGTFSLTVVSDEKTADITRVPDGTVKTSENNGFNVVFDDLGDSASVPDAGNTLLLLSLAGCALVCMQRRHASVRA